MDPTYLRGERETPPFKISCCISNTFSAAVLLLHGADINSGDFENRPIIYAFYESGIRIQSEDSVLPNNSIYL